MCPDVCRQLLLARQRSNRGLPHRLRQRRLLEAVRVQPGGGDAEEQHVHIHVRGADEPGGRVEAGCRDGKPRAGASGDPFIQEEQ